MTWNPRTTPNFKASEMACKDPETGGLCPHCGGRSDMDPQFMKMLQEFRNRVGKFQVNSGMRCKDHPIESSKEAPGAHSTGKAVDGLAVRVGLYEALKTAFEVGFTGIGVENGFLHLDIGHPSKHRPASWTY